MHVTNGDDPRDWTWELSTTPVTRWQLARILLADAAHERLVPVTEWLGKRHTRLAHRAQDATANLEIRLAYFIHARRTGRRIRVALTREQATTLDP